MLTVVILPLMLHGGDLEPENLLAKKLNKKEAIIWYLFHSGWAIKTQNHLLIFDYWESEDRNVPEHRSLSSGFINPAEISGQNVYVFISHSHADHYDPEILNWSKSIKQIKYIFGWKATNAPSHILLGKKREVLKVDDLEVFNIHHTFDNIPESAFLVRVDGLTFYHAGDHGHSKGSLNPRFKDNNDYLASKAKKVDFIFIPTWGGEYYTIEKLSPKVVFPMHDGGSERQYKKFAQKTKKRGLKVKVAAATKRGDVFFYSKGKLKNPAKSF
jgi:L-ascorbate metabolism protein UlaG (beta-lactamase superfamily)